MIVVFVASLLLVAPSEAPPPDGNGDQTSEVAAGQEDAVRDAEEALEAAGEAAEAAAEQAEEAAEQAGEAVEQAAEAADEADEGDGGRVCTRRHETNMLGHTRTRKVCRSR